MTDRYPKDTEDAIREALKRINYQYGISYAKMATLSGGFKESTLKGFANNENRLPDERDSLFYFLQLARRLSDQEDCDSLSNLSIPGWKTLQATEPAEVDGDLTKELIEYMEDGGEMSRADKSGNIEKMKRIRRHMGSVLSQIDAEIAFKESKS